MTRTGAAAMADVTRQTFYDWLDADPTFSDAVQKAESVAESRYLSRVTKAAMEGTWQAAAWWLERRMPEHYSLRNLSKVEVSGPDGGPIALSPVLAALPQDDLEAKIKELEAELDVAEPDPDQA